MARNADDIDYRRPSVAHQRASARPVSSIRELYVSAIRAAATRPVRGDPDAALDDFLSLNAAYFLGEWLPYHAHAVLVGRLAEALDGLADLPVPADIAHATQLAQHVRELAAEFGPTAWLAAMAERTAAWAPARPEPAGATAGGDAHALLLVHARRRLWQLAHPSPPAPATSPPAAILRRAARAAARSQDGHRIQVVEAALAETHTAPALPSGLLGALGKAGGLRLSRQRRRRR